MVGQYICFDLTYNDDLLSITRMFTLVSMRWFMAPINICLWKQTSEGTVLWSGGWKFKLISGLYSSLQLCSLWSENRVIRVRKSWLFWIEEDSSIHLALFSVRTWALLTDPVQAKTKSSLTQPWFTKTLLYTLSHQNESNPKNIFVLNSQETLKYNTVPKVEEKKFLFFINQYFNKDCMKLKYICFKSQAILKKSSVFQCK